jgi:hypothetical protein
MAPRKCCCEHPPVAAIAAEGDRKDGSWSAQCCMRHPDVVQDTHGGGGWSSSSRTDPRRPDTRGPHASGRSTRQPLLGVNPRPIWLIGQLSPNSIIRFNVLPSYSLVRLGHDCLGVENRGISCIVVHRVGALTLECFNRLSLCFIGPSGPQKVLESFGRLRHGCRGRPLGIQGLS